MADDATATGRRPAAIALLAVLLAAVLWWAGPGRQPPPVQPASAPATAFSAERARVHLEAIASRPRPPGSAGHAATKAHLLDALRGLGLEPQVQHATVMRGSGATLTVASVANILARLPGTATATGGDAAPVPGRRPAVVLMAHHDSVAHAPGVNDAGNGVAAILETVRALRAGVPLRNDVIVLFTDAEEAGLLGARAWVENHPWAVDTGVVLNAEGRGQGGPVYMFRTVGANGGMVRTLARALPGAQADSLSSAVFALMPNDTDLSVLRDAGHLGMDFANLRGLSHYHTALDNLAQADPRTLQHHGDQMLALARAFGEQDLAALAGPERIFFPAPALGLVHYPASWALPLAVLATALLAVLLAYLYRRGRWRLRGVALGLTHLLVAGLLAAALVALAWSGIAPWLPELPGFRHGAPYGSHRYLIGLLLPALALYLFSLAWLHRRLRAEEWLLAAVLSWWPAALTSAFWLPGASWLLLWPPLAALAGLAALSAGRAGRPWLAAAVLALSALPVIGLLAPMIAGLDEAMGMAAAPAVVVLSIFALALLVLPLITVMRDRLLAWLLPLALVLAGVSVLVHALAGAGIDAARPLPETLEYVADIDRGQAYWASVDTEPGPWARQHLGLAAQRSALPAWAPPLPGSGGRDPWLRSGWVRHQDAPDAVLRAESVADGQRHLRLRISSPAHAQATVITLPEAVPVTSLRIDGRLAPAGIATQGLEIVWHAPPADGADIALAIPAGASLSLRLRSNLPGVPGMDGGPAPWPAHSMPAGPWTGRTRLLRTVEFPPVPESPGA